MSESGIRVFIPDPEHGEGDWPDGASDGPVAGPSAQFRHQLESEYGEHFRFISIGTGAALAAYFVELISHPYRAAAVAAALFFAGKPIKEAFEAWAWTYERLSKFFHHEPTFNRDGAAFLAYKAVADKLGGIPESFQLKGFIVQHRLAYLDPSNIPDPGLLTMIQSSPDRVERAGVYVFQIVADSRDFRVEIDGHHVKFLQE